LCVLLWSLLRTGSALPVRTIIASASAVAAEPRMLGVVEEMRETTAAGERLETSLRLGFLRTATGWTPACSRSSELRNDGCSLSDPGLERRWSVLFRGNQVGNVTTAGWLEDRKSVG